MTWCQHERNQIHTLSEHLSVHMIIWIGRRRGVHMQFNMQQLACNEDDSAHHV